MKKTPRIEDLIPHRSGMKLIDRIIRLEDNLTLAAAVVSERWPLFRDNRVSSLIALELAAQTAGAMKIWRRGETKNQDGLGFLAGIKSARFFQADVAKGVELLIETACPKILEHHEGQYGVVSGRVRSSQGLLAEISLQIISLARLPGS
ncbi:MAG: hypothetical protein V1816_24785 [Pseudomonadota bacterium]